MSITASQTQYLLGVHSSKHLISQANRPAAPCCHLPPQSLPGTSAPFWPSVSTPSPSHLLTGAPPLIEAWKNLQLRSLISPRPRQDSVPSQINPESKAVSLEWEGCWSANWEWSRGSDKFSKALVFTDRAETSSEQEPFFFLSWSLHLEPKQIHMLLINLAATGSQVRCEAECQKLKTRFPPLPRRSTSVLMPIQKIKGANTSTLPQQYRWPEKADVVKNDGDYGPEDLKISLLGFSSFPLWWLLSHCNTDRYIILLPPLGALKTLLDSSLNFSVLPFPWSMEIVLRWSSRVESVCWCQASGFCNTVAFRPCSNGTLGWIFSKEKQKMVNIVSWKYLWTWKKPVPVSCSCFGHKNHILGIAEKWRKSQFQRELLRFEQNHLILEICICGGEKHKNLLEKL